MKLHEYVDTDELKKLIESKLVTARRHPVYPLVILNYSPAAQGERNWGDVLTKCRGLVYEEGTEDIYAVPFKKFWNYNDAAHPETLEENLPSEAPDLYEKVDGSLGVGFFYKQEFIIATRGSFQSDQAKWANNWAKPRVLFEPSPATFLFEIVIPTDRKVVNYDYSGLVYLGKIDSEGEHPPRKHHINWIRGVKVVKSIAYGTLAELAARDEKNEEGYVAVWYNRFLTFRVKIKFATYKRLHRMFFQTTTDVIWELLKTDKLTPYIAQIDDHGLFAWVSHQANVISLDKMSLGEVSRQEYRAALRLTNELGEIPEKERRKVFALQASKSSHPGLLFLLYDNKMDEYEESLWKIAKPKNSFYREVE